MQQNTITTEIKINKTICFNNLENEIATIIEEFLDIINPYYFNYNNNKLSLYLEDIYYNTTIEFNFNLSEYDLNKASHIYKLTSDIYKTINIKELKETVIKNLIPNITSTKLKSILDIK
jgi:hypothetical protein